MSLRSLLNQTADVYSMSTSANAMGGSARTYASRISDMPCLIQTKTMGEADEYGKITQRLGTRLYCEATTAYTAIQPQDRIICGSLTYEVTGTYNVSNRDKLLQVDLELIS